MEDQKASFVAQEKYDQLESEVVHLRQQLSELQRMIFGAKSERFIPSASNQIPLFELPNQKEEQTEEQEISYSRKTKKEKEQPVRALLAAHLPRKEEVIEPEEKEEGSKKIGEEITEILEYNPAKLYVRRIVRPKYVSPETGSIVIGTLPSLPIPKGNAGASLLAHIQVSKWVDHLPYYRQIQIFKRSEVRLNKSTLNGWFNASCNLLEPLYQSLVKAVQSQAYLQADESSIRVQDKDKQGATHTGFHWVYHAPLSRLVVFDYQPTRSSRGPTAFLQNFEGTLQTDGYTAYNELVKAKGIPFLACMAHARRYFEKALDNDQFRAQYALSKIQELYTLERTMKEEELNSVQTQDLRQRYALPILEEWKIWLDGQQVRVTPKSPIGKAINYTLNLWSRLIRYVEDGNYLIDNNPIENTIRPLALGRKNYLFAGSHQAAQRAAMMYSFFATCKLNQVNPYKWLLHVLTKIPDHKINQIHLLLPHNFIEPK